MSKIVERPPSGRFTVSSATFNIHSEVDNINYSIEGITGPSSRHKIITQPRRSRPRIPGVSLSPSDGFRGGGGGNESSRPSSKISEFQEGGDGEQNFTSTSKNHQTTKSYSGGKSTQRPYLSSSRIHKCPTFNEAIRADILLAASRQYEDHTTGSFAQVPVSYRKWSPTPPQPVTSLPLPVVPVRGSVVLTSLRSQPTPPTNSVRTRAKGELVYNGPSHLLREQAKALKDAQRQQEEDPYMTSSTTTTTTTTPSKNNHNGNNFLETQAYGEKKGSSMPSNESSSQVTDISFVSVFGNPRITTVPDLVETYHVPAPPERHSYSQRRSPVASPTYSDTSNDSSKQSKSKINPKFAKMPRFPVN